MFKNIHLTINLPGSPGTHALPPHAVMVAERGSSSANTRSSRRSVPDQEGFIRVNSRTSYPRHYPMGNDEMNVLPVAVRETHDGKVSTGRRTAQSKDQCRSKKNRYEDLEEVVDEVASNLRATIRQEVAAFRSASAKASGLKRSDEGVYAPHLFDELSAPKKYQLNEDGRKLMFAIRYYFRKVQAELKRKPTPGFRSRRRRIGNQGDRGRRNRNPHVAQACDTADDESFQTADCCDRCMRPTFVTAPCRMDSTREHARATSNHPTSPPNNVTIDTHDLFRRIDEIEADRDFQESMENVHLQEDTSPGRSSSVNADSNSSGSNDNNVNRSETLNETMKSETVRNDDPAISAKDARRREILQRTEAALLAEDSDDDRDSEDEVLEQEQEAKLSPSR